MNGKYKMNLKIRINTFNIEISEEEITKVEVLKEKSISEIDKIIEEMQEQKYNLSNLKEIVCTKDFHEEIQEFIRNNNLDNKVSKRACGKVIHLNKKVYYIFLHENVICEIIGNGTHKKFAKNAIYHELLHVHDNNVREKIEFDFNEEDETDQLLNLWGEYFAHRRAMEIAPIDFNLQSRKKELVDYEIGSSENDIYYLSYLNWFIRCLGDIHGANLGHGVLNELVKDTKLEDEYSEKIELIMNMLYEKYPKWDDDEPLISHLYEIILQFKNEQF